MRRVVALVSRFPRFGPALVERLVAAGTGIVGFGILARILGPADLGNWILAFTLASLADALRAGVVQSAYLRLAPGTCGVERRAWNGSLLAVASGCTAVGVALLCAAAAIAQAQGHPAAAWIRYAAALPLSTLLVSVPSWWLQAEESFRSLVAVRLVWAAGTLGGLGIVALVGPSPEAVVSVWALSAAAAGLTALGLTDRSQRAYQGSQQATDLLWRQGRRSVLAVAASTLNRSSDLLLVGGFASPVAAAACATASRLVDVVEIPLQAASSVLAPALGKAARGSRGLLLDTAASPVRALTVATAIVSIGLLCFAPQLVWLLSGSENGDATAAVRILALLNVLRPLDRLVGLTLESLGAASVNVRKTFLTLAVNLVLDVLALRFAPSALPAWIAAGSLAAVSIGLLFGERRVAERTGSTLTGAAFGAPGVPPNPFHVTRSVPNPTDA